MSREKGIQWNDRQRQAIGDGEYRELREHNMLVSAAAGSGKTAVLIERIKRLIIEEGVNVDEMLVVTFTRAAASEMKEKLITAIYDEIESEPSQIPRMREQLARMYRASICTFHAFAHELIQNYFYLIDIDPQAVICDETESVILQQEAMDQVFEDFYAAEDAAFFDFLSCYGASRGDDGIKNDLIQLYKKLMAMPAPAGWLEDALQQMEEAGSSPQDSPLVKEVMREAACSLQRAADFLDRALSLLEMQGLEGLYGKLAEARTALDAMLACTAFEELAQQIRGFSWPKLAASKEEKEGYKLVRSAVDSLRKRAKEEIDSLKKDFFTLPLAVYGEDMAVTAGSGRMVQKILHAFDTVYKERKADRNRIDFSDVEHDCLQILSDTAAASEYRHRFRYIFIDEYQDSNYLQEEIINRIRRADNVFMVGDIKQSIYRFRQAEPDIFQSKYRLYQDPAQGIRIDLNQNFRSKPEIIRAVNGLFAPLMEDYDEEAALHGGCSDPAGIHSSPALVVVDAGQDEEKDLPEEIARLRTEQLEAMAVARRIKGLLGKDIYDNKAGRVRPIEKKDIVILMRAVRGTASVFLDVLRENGLDAVLDDNSGYFDTPEIAQFLDFLRLIDNERNDIGLLSVMRSCAFGFSIDDLIEIRLAEKEGAFCDAAAAYAAAGADQTLAARLRALQEQLAHWRLEAAAMPLDDFIWKLMLDTGYYTFMGALAGGRQRQANLRALVDKAAAFCRQDTGTLYQLLRYIDAMQDRKVDVGQAGVTGENEDVIRIMTIHKSKGLEFPVTIVSGLGRRFNFREDNALAVMHKDIGIGMNRIKRDEHWKRHTLPQNLIRRRERAEEMKEEIRILYVALTRAKDELILTAAVNDAEKKIEAYDNDAAGESCYLDLVYPNAKAAGFAIDLEDRAFLADRVLEDVDHRRAMKESLLHAPAPAGQEAEAEALDRCLSFRYPFEGDRRLRSKYSVSQLNARGDESGPSLVSPLFTVSRQAFTAAEKGTFVHTMMEHLDFAAALEGGRAYLTQALAQMVEEQLLLPAEAETIDLASIEAFFDTPIGRRAAAAKVRKETPFNMMMELDGGEIMVQGIIDCWFLDEKGLVLLDYKTNQRMEHIKERYEEQIRIYCRALAASLGRPVDEAYLYLFKTGRFIPMAVPAAAR